MPNTAEMEKALTELKAQAEVQKQQQEAAAWAMVRDLNEPMEMTLSSTHSNIDGLTTARFTMPAPDEFMNNHYMYGPGGQIDLSLLVETEALRGRVAGDKVTLTINWA